ncbi:Decapping nuclease DXO homolog, chloroplastic [Galdieria sulphuraria]|uniref:Decapping nuclease n=1 Tax=Galdieria sulphuraria TaxID=130081 RepID=M2X0H1_GALSU|nr:glycine-rich protein [Galdieria sulphuraria]EME29830.1 glycine-rich protein [Galdieria sulphuraria]GJD06819.1 Decapping nuclease DXO homolog, chloroplastic [Galdieria sulphuraria]|eukprot:XP_005706350.1 glycine-rich protein [Galdieria sulphuraria]
MNQEKRPFFDVQRCLKELKTTPKKVPVSSPVEVACFSRLSASHYVPCSRQALKTLKIPQVPSCLNQGYESFIPKDQSSSISLSPVRESLEKAFVNVDDSIQFLTFRNNLNKIALTPYNTEESWKMTSHLENNLIVLNICPSEELEPVTDRDKYFAYCGYKFEHLCCESDDVVVDANQEFCSIVKTSIGKHTLLISAQVDCWDAYHLWSKDNRAEYPICHYVELKTMKKWKKEQVIPDFYQRKYLRYWVQCFLAGIPHLFIGYRDDRRKMLMETEYIPVDRLPEICRESWEPHICLGFMDSFLYFVFSMHRAFPSIVILWEYQPSAQKIWINY